MSPTPIDRSPDLIRLRDEGYQVSLTTGQNHLLIDHVPYVDASCGVRYGRFVCPLNLQGDVAQAPPDHVMHFAGDFPCHEDGRPISEIQHGSGAFNLDGVLAQHSFSAKPPAPFTNYYDKVTSYVRILASPAVVLDASARACTFHVAANTDDALPFAYADTATSRAGISEPTSRLIGKKIAIVGIGGTGSFVLELVAKTPVSEIHLYDADMFTQHNAFRSPGAADIALWQAEAPEVYKADHFAEVYSRLHLGIVPHRQLLDASNVAELGEMDFVFLCVDDGGAKRIVIEYLRTVGVPLVDVGMGLILESGKIFGCARVTTVTDAHHDHVNDRISFGVGDPDDVYAQNIQVADINALNAALAVIKWKKLMGFYDDQENEHHSAYIIYSNNISNAELE